MSTFGYVLTYQDTDCQCCGTVNVVREKRWREVNLRQVCGPRALKSNNELYRYSRVSQDEKNKPFCKPVHRWVSSLIEDIKDCTNIKIEEKEERLRDARKDCECQMGSTL